MVRGRVCGCQVVQGPRWLGLRCPVTLAKKIILARTSKLTPYLGLGPIIILCSSLGLTISDNLKWSSQINKMCNKASSPLGFVRRKLKHCNIRNSKK